MQNERAQARPGAGGVTITAGRRTWLAAGIAALVGAVCAMGADIASGWSATPDSAMNTALSLRIGDVAPLLLVKSPPALIAGHYLAVVFIPFGIFGIWHVAQVLRPAGRILTFWFLISGVLLYAAGTAYHATYGFVATVLQTGDAALIGDIAPFFEPFGTAIVAGMIVTMLPLIAAILTGRTIYPRWFALLTPLPLQLALSALAALFPPAAANFLIVTGLNGSMAIFFAASLIITARKQP